MRTVFLPAIDRLVTLRAYIDAVKLAKANPDRTFRYGLVCWWPCTGEEIVRQFVDGVNHRINEGIPYHRRGKSMVGS